MPTDLGNKQSVNYESTAGLERDQMAQQIDEMKLTAKNRRRLFERRWYDNAFFDDGFHFRYLSRSSNKIVDLSERSTIYTPQRSIPKASRQIRGIMNLLMSSDPTPTVYPDPVDKNDYANNQVLYDEIVKNNKDIARKRGMWIEHEWREADKSGETVLDKVAFMVLLAMKFGVSYLKIWPDEHEEKINTSVRDAFDIYLLGNYSSIYETPFCIEAAPQLIAQIKSNPYFDPDQLKQINPDNRKASSEIKEAYLNARYGRDTTADQSATLILNDAFVSEYVTRSNVDRIKAQSDGEKIMKHRDIGSPIIRHTFTAGGVWLYDKYTNLSEYPYVDFRMEPGPIYNVPMIERFMPANKSLDSVVSRVERYTHTMVTGSWLKRRTEQFKINNIAGGQIIEYDAVPPTQNQIAPIPPFVYEFIGLLTNFIEEQGVSTTTLGKLPNGVKANAAIESLKESEYANLVVASRRLKATIKKIAERFFAIADEGYITPQEIAYKDKGNLVTFSVMGQSALKARKELKVATPHVIPLAKDVSLDIEIEQGMAYTKEGQKATMQEVMNTMIQGVQVQAIPPQALQSVYQKYLEIYQFGATEEFMEDLDEAFQQGTNLSQQQLMTVKTAILEALKDAGEIGPEGDQAKIQTTKIGTLEALRDSGLAKSIQQPVKESVSINYKDAPPSIQRQMEAKAGFTPSTQPSPSTSEQAVKHAKIITELMKAQTEAQAPRQAQANIQATKSTS